MPRFFISALFLIVTATSFSQAPGGVSAHLVLWAKADAGTSTTVDNEPVLSWTEQSSNLRELLGYNSPLFIRNAANYNPGVLYNLSAYHGFSSDYPVVSNSSLFVAGIPMASASIDTFRIPWTSDGETQHPLAVSNSKLGHFTTTGASSMGQQTSLHWTDNEMSFARTHIFSSNDVAVSKAGSADTVLAGASASGTDGYYYLGSSPNTTTTMGDGEGFGNITETIIYDEASIDPADILKIESYLAMKYSVTKDNIGGGDAGDYKLSDNSVAWDADMNSNCHHEIIALVRDDASGLLQKQSHTADDKLRVFIDALAADNISNAGSITNDASSLLIGNNGGILQGNRAASRPTGIYNRFERVWKITNNHFEDPFSIEIKWDSVGAFDKSHIRLLVSADPDDFSSAEIYSAPTDITISVGSIIIGNINGTTSIVPPGNTLYFTIGSADALTPLPVGLTAFTATATADKAVQLNWQTSNEINSSQFEVERSANGNSWQTVATVKARGNSAIAQQYATLDKNPDNGISYYRLKLVDRDGKFSYSETRSVRINNNGNGLKVYPNPVHNQVTIKASAEELKSVNVYTMTGQDVSCLVKTISHSNTAMVLDVSKLGAGNYTIKTTSTATKMLKQ